MHGESLLAPPIVLAAVHWEVFIIPMIALGVWLLGTLFKGSEEARANKNRRPGSAAGRAGARRPVSDLDRFLEEARRRRETEERPKPPPPPVRAPVARPPQRERLSQRKEPPPRPVPTARLVAESSTVVPVARIVLPSAVTEAAPVIPSIFEVTSLAPPAVLADERKPIQTPIVQEVRSLLSKPQTAGTAFVLREIFDGPLCRRRRR